MRCLDCQTEPAKPDHFCECCGKKLLSQERDDSEALLDKVSAVQSASASGTASTGCCETCGEPSGESDLCETCRQAFNSVLVSPAPAPAGGKSATVENSEPAAIEHGTLTEETVSAAQPDETDGAAAAAWAELALPDRAPRKDEPDTREAETSHANQETDPPVAGDVPFVPAPSRHLRPVVLAAAVVLCVAAVGAPQVSRWLDTRKPVETPGTPSPTIAGTDQPAAANMLRESVSAAPPAPTISERRNTIARGPSRARRQNASTRPIAPAVAVTPAPATAAMVTVAPSPSPAPVVPPPAPAAAPLPAPAPAPAPAAAPAPAPAPAPPTGRFFEATDVDEIPLIVTRVEPQLPAELLARPFRDVVVVRVLVSQSGHPFRVSLLRKSKLGRSLDDAVVEAVTQWTFSPAQKRGEPVSAWYNIGLPFGVQ